MSSSKPIVVQATYTLTSSWIVPEEYQELVAKGCYYIKWNKLVVCEEEGGPEIATLLPIDTDNSEEFDFKRPHSHELIEADEGHEQYLAEYGPSAVEEQESEEEDKEAFLNAVWPKALTCECAGGTHKGSCSK